MKHYRDSRKGSRNDGGEMLTSPARERVNDKQRAADGFSRQVDHTKKINIAAAPMRGGWRL